MKRTAVVSAVFLLTAIGCADVKGDELVLVSVGQPQRVAAPILNPSGRVLSGRFGGSEAEVVEVVGGRPVQRARVMVDGIVTDLQLARGPMSTPALAVVTSCPGGFGNQPATEEFRTCVTPLAFTSIELDEEGRQQGEKRILPPGLSEGSLFGSDKVFVWAGWDSNRAIYVDGTWRRINSTEPVSTPVAERCVTGKDLWVLRGESGARTFSGADGERTASRNFRLFRYGLDGSVDNPWEHVLIPGLQESSVAELACGEAEAFVRVGNSLYSTANPQISVQGINVGIDELRGNPARRPVLFLEDMTCAVVGPGGRLLPGREKQGSATSTSASSCDTVPWPRGSGFLGLSQDMLGNIRLGGW